MWRRILLAAGWRLTLADRKERWGRLFRSRRLRLNITGLAWAWVSVSASHALTNNVALTPPMGWNDWNSYGCGITESIVTNNANIIVAKGLKAAGYQYVDIDDCWQASRDTNGLQVADPGKFPSGIPRLANQVHSLGLKFGLYSDEGTNTCGGNPGSYGYEYVDANTYAAWGVDYLKYDNCYVPSGANAQADYGRMSDGLIKSGRPTVFCICGGNSKNAKAYESWSPVLGNYWRTTGDISDSYATVISHIDPNSATAFAAGPGRWNDPDMLEVGKGGLTTNQDRAHFTMWCIMAAPLIMGNNLTSISAAALATLTNSEAIAVDQDPLGEQGVKVVNNASAAGTNEVWSKTLGYDFSTKAVVLFNRLGAAANITCNWTNLGLLAGTATVRDLWAHSNLGMFTNSFTARVAANTAMLLKVVGTPPVLPGLGTNFLGDLQAIYAYTGFGTITKDRSIGGNPLTLGGVTFSKGIGVNSFSGVEYDLGGVCSRFQATIGVDDEVIGQGAGSVNFQVFADGTEIYDSGFMYTNTPALAVNLDVSGVRRLVLGVGDADDNINYDHGDWADARVTVTNTTPQAPYAPTGLTANPGNAIALTWNATVSATNYNLKRSTIDGGPYTTIATVPIATFTDSNIVSGTTYYYVVSAVSSLGESAHSSQIGIVPCSPPSVVANVRATASGSQIVVSWNASPGATGYSVLRSTSSTPYSPIAANLTTTNFTDSAVIIGMTYYYVVTASNACNQSGDSAFVAATVAQASTVTKLNTATMSNGAADWSAAPGAYAIGEFTGATVSAANLAAMTLGGNVSMGELQVAGGLNGPLTITDTHTLTLNTNTTSLNLAATSSGQSLTMACPVVMAGAITLGSDSLLTVASAVTTSSSSSSAVDIGCAGASHGSLTLIAGGSLTLTAGRMIVGSDANGDYTQSGGAFSQGSTGPVYIANNAPSGGTTVSISGGTFASAGDIHLCVRDNAAFTISGGTVTAPHFYFGTLGASGAAGTGTLNLNGGTLVVGAVALNNSANTANLYFNGGTLQASAASIAFLTGLNVTQIKSGGAYINDGSYAITMGQALAPYSGSTGGLTKCGTGTLTLSGANTYAGSTTVSNGTLALTGSGSISNSSTIAVAFGATLDASQRSDGTLALGAGQSLTGQGVVKGNIMVGSGAMLAPGNSIGALICSNNLTLGGGSTTFMELSKSPVTNDVAQVAGTLVYGGTLRLTNVSSGSFAAGDSFKLFSAVSFSGAFTNLVPAIPAVDLAWDTSGLTNGTLRVVSAPTPQPFLGVNVNGRVLVFSGSNGVPGWPGCLLAGTNLLEPFSNWTIAATNLFDGNGNCNFTNSADPNWPQSFYLIKLE